MGDDIWFIIAPLWIAVVVGISIVYRKNAEKPIFPKFPENALFAEKRASSSFASNCLMVWVTNRSVHLVPQFPFNLMFLPEIYRLEKEVPISRVSKVEISNSWFGNNLIVTYDEGGPRKLRVRVRAPQAAKEAIERAKQMPRRP